MNPIPKTETPDLINAMEHWAKTVAKNGGIAAVTIQEGADRLRELQARAEKAEIALAEIDPIIWASLSEKEWYDEKHDIIDIIEDWKKTKRKILK